MEAPLSSTVESGSYLLWYVQCPYCPKKHQHGGGYVSDPDTLPQFRSSHCGKGEYKIVAPVPANDSNNKEKGE